jgi:hypothetical protein
MEEFLGEMNAVLAKYDAMTVGECPNTPNMNRVLKYVSAKEKQLNMVFQFVSHSQNSLFCDIKETNSNAGRCGYRPRPLQIPNNAEKLYTPKLQSCNPTYARLDTWD